GQTAGDGLEAEQIPNDARLRPRPGDAIHVGAQELEWQENQDADPVFGRIFEGKFPNAHRVAYGVCYLRAEEPLADLRWRLGGRDEPTKAYLNGQLVLWNRPGADGSSGQTTAAVNLVRGTNVLAAKIVNKR